MNPEIESLGRRVTACPAWRWLPGMLAVVPPVHDGTTGYLFRISDMYEPLPPRAYPDLSDPATLGCLLALVQERYLGKVVISLGNGWWSVETDGETWDNDNTMTPLQALVAALESSL